jgi:predicted DNA-binding transcriptional regulator YafY
MIDSQVLEAVQAGLFEERCLAITYRRRSASESKLHQIVPLGRQ